MWPAIYNFHTCLTSSGSLVYVLIPVESVTDSQQFFVSRIVYYYTRFKGRVLEGVKVVPVFTRFTTPTGTT